MSDLIASLRWSGQILILQATSEAGGNAASDVADHGDTKRVLPGNLVVSSDSSPGFDLGVGVVDEVEHLIDVTQLSSDASEAACSASISAA